MKFIPTLIFALNYSLALFAQSNPEKVIIDDEALRKRITISDFVLCQTSFNDLFNLDSSFKKVEVEEMDLPNNCVGNDVRFENGKGYSFERYKGIIFQKDLYTKYISKIILTKEFKGTLPNGISIEISQLSLKDMFKIYPQLYDKWGSRGCSNYWSFTDDTLTFYVKIDTFKKPQFPIDKEYYLDKPIEAIELTMFCYKIFSHNKAYMKEVNEYHD